MYVTNVTVTSEVTDATGNVFLLGTYTGSGSIFAQGSPVYTSAGSVYLFKMSPITGLVWALGFTGSPGTTPLSIDPGSNVCVALNTTGTFNVFNAGGTPVYTNTGFSFPSSFIFKVSSGGSVLAQNMAGGTTNPTISNIQVTSSSFDANGNLWAFGNQYGYVSVLDQNFNLQLKMAPLPGVSIPGQTIGVQFNQAMVPSNYVQISNTFVQSSASEGTNAYAVSNSFGLSSYYYLNGTKTASLAGPGTNVVSVFQISGSPWSVSANSVSRANAFAVVAGSNVYLTSSIGSLRTVYQGSSLNTTLPASTGTSVTSINLQGTIQSVNYFDGATCNTAPTSDSFFNVFFSLKSQAATVTLKNSAGTVLTTLAVAQGNSFVAKTTTSAVIGQTIFSDYLNPVPVPVYWSNGLGYSYQQSSDTTGILTNEIGSTIGTNPLGTTNVWINSLYSTGGTPVLLDLTSNLSLGTNLVATTGSFRVQGNIVSTGDITGFSQLSDRRLKTDLTPLSNCLELVMGLNPVEFTWNDQEINWYRRGQRDIGLIAQEAPPMVTGDFDGYRTVRYDRLVPYLIGAIQELGLRLNP